MPRTDDGEFELVLGNRQLLSVLFIVVILLGVFFAMGYVVGRSVVSPSPPVVAQQQAPAPSESATAPVGRDNTREAEPTPVAAEETAAAEPPPTQTSPVRETSSTPAAPAKEAAVKGTTAAKSAPPRVPASTPVTAADATPPPGFYYQIAATTLPEAQILAEALRKHQLAGLVAPVPGKDGLYRVLVGPLEGVEATARTRERLEKAGFKNFIGRRI